LNKKRFAICSLQFYFVINLAVGGVNGYFPDNAENPGGKPWSNNSTRVREKSQHYINTEYIYITCCVAAIYYLSLNKLGSYPAKELNT
jgi:hypothetical protein